MAPILPNSQFDMPSKLWHNLATITTNGIDGNEYARCGLAATLGRCEPGQTPGPKILPELLAETPIGVSSHRE